MTFLLDKKKKMIPNRRTVITTIYVTEAPLKSCTMYLFGVMKLFCFGFHESPPITSCLHWKQI